MYAGLAQNKLGIMEVITRSQDKKPNDNKLKTSALAQLDNNLIVDLEGGSTFIDAMAVQARTIEDLGQIAQAIRAKNEEVGHKFYKHITKKISTYPQL